MKYTTINIQGNLLSEEILQKVETAEASGQQAPEFWFEPGANIRSEIEYAWSRIKLDWKHFTDKSTNLPASDPYGTTLSRKWMEQFLSSLAFDLSKEKSGLQGDNNQSYTVSHTAANLDQLPVHIVGFIEPNNPDKNTLDVKSSGGTSKFSPHGTMQEYLNVTEHVYGIATNGLFLRLIRDSGRLIKLTYVEFDLKRMLDEDKYSEFTLLYRLLHASRFPRSKAEADQCLLEKYYQDSIETGNRIRDGLSLAVKESLLALGNGFLQHENNTTLRGKIQSGDLSSKDYYRQLLRIIYRFLFLMVTEERDLVYDPEDKSEDTQKLKKIYLQFYSIARLRKLSENRYVYESQFNDLWQGLVQSFLLFEAGGNGKKLGIQPLDGDLFSYNAIQDLQDSLISNKLLLECIRNMNEFRDDKKNLVAINYRSLDVEELGSVYEGLLELHPVIENIEAGNPTHTNFTFHEGTDRKTTGSYYTRPELVNELIKSALIPVIEERLKENTGNKDAQVKALLKLKVCDAAAGSGHMLLAAARTIAWYLARVQSGEENPAPSIYRKCLREVIQHCIYAVDYNPDAVELCKLALWLEGHNSGKPLSFLDHKIRNGNSLVGVTDLSVLQKGIPDDAFNPVTGDDKKVCQELKKDNAKYNKTKQTTLDFNQSNKIDTTAFTGDFKELENLQQDDIDGVKQVKTKFEKLRSNHAWFNDWRACNLWTATFFWNYTEENKQAAPNSERIAKFLTNPAAAYGPMIGKADALSMEHKFFHWPLEFPDVFEQGGFDVMLGNPPWERIKLQEKEFFSNRDSRIAKTKNASERKSLIKQLKEINPEIYKEYTDALHYSEAESKFLRNSNKFPLSTYGDINTYSVFCEHYYNSTNDYSRIGIIIPTGIATDNTTKNLFADFVQNERLDQIIGFENEENIFPDVHHAFKFCALILSGKKIKNEKSRFTFFHRNFTTIENTNRHFYLSKSDFELLNPNTKTCPIFRSQQDFTLTKKIYSSFPILIDEKLNPSEANYGFFTMFHMTNDSGLFAREEINNLPLYEAKMFSQFDHRYATYENATQANINEGNLPQFTVLMHQDPSKLNQPNYYVTYEAVNNIISNSAYEKKYLLAYRGISNSASERTMISSLIPIYGIGNSAPCIRVNNGVAIDFVLLLSSLNSLCVDYVTKQKFSGNNLNFFIVKQIPVPTRKMVSQKLLDIILLNTVELSYSSWDIKAFADDIWKESDTELKAAIQKQWDANKATTGGHTWAPPDWCEIDPEGCPLPPFKWDEERRALLKAELDAIYAKLYGLTTEELRYILDPQDVYGPDFPGETFRVLKEKEIRFYGEYRTRRLVLEAWERLNS